MINVTNNLSRAARRAHKAEYLVLKPLVEECLASIERVGAWPMNVGEISIVIVDGPDVFTRSDPHIDMKNADERNVYRETNLRLEIGVELLRSSIFQDFRAAEIPDAETLTHVLGHEIFHLEQAWRQVCCNFPFRLVRSNFARAVRQEMNPEWREAVKVLALTYRTHVKASLNDQDYILDAHTARASDTVSECCADLLGLKIFEAVYDSVKAKACADRLVTYRLANEAAGPVGYQSGKSLEEFLTKHPSSNNDLALIVQETWKMAFASLALSPDLPEHAAAAISAVQSLEIVGDLPDVFRGVALRRSP